MVVKIEPELNKVYFINKYTMFHILKGKFDAQQLWLDAKNHGELIKTANLNWEKLSKTHN